MKKEKNQEKSIKNFILESEFFAKKSLGQNFLIDQNIIKKIANFLSKYSFEPQLEPSRTLSSKSSCELFYSNNPNNPKYIIEIGSGPGILTKEIAKQFPHSTIFAIEKDDRFIKNLKTISNVYVIHKDALKCDWNEIAQQMREVRNTETREIETTLDTQINTTLDEQGNPQINPQENLQSNPETNTHNFSTHSFKSHSFNQGHKQNQNIDKISVIGNLPYNVSVPILFSLLEKRHLFDQFIFMFQKEVANRITAKPNNSSYGKLSIMTQIYSVPTKILHVPPTVFWPQPKIDSEIVRFKIQNNFMHDIEPEKIVAGNYEIVPENEIIAGGNKKMAIESEIIVPKNEEIQSEEFHDELHKEIEKLTFIAFQQRRKTFQSIFRNAVKNKHYNENELDTSYDKSSNKSLAFYEKIFMKLQLDIKNRPENFSPQEFCKIATEILKLRKN
jgi:16S rRNA A1518/A1519 N6-dimethyltransferase RsmA/KsgA/DIM1 with predicted DNA glycosylase/AP lyase activity